LTGRGFQAQVADSVAAARVLALVRDVDEGLRRLREYSLPREYARLQGLGRLGSALGKTLIFHREYSGRTRIILVPETLGF